MSFSIILPTLNEKGHILELINEISNIFQNKNLLYEIIVVDDSSTDGTIEEIEKDNKNLSFIKTVLRKNLKRNLAMSINDGIKIAQYEFTLYSSKSFKAKVNHVHASETIYKSSVLDSSCASFVSSRSRVWAVSGNSMK